MTNTRKKPSVVAQLLVEHLKRSKGVMRVDVEPLEAHLETLKGRALVRAIDEVVRFAVHLRDVEKAPGASTSLLEVADRIAVAQNSKASGWNRSTKK